MVAIRNLGLMVVAYAVAAGLVIALIVAGGLYGVRASASLFPEAEQGTSPFQAQLETARMIRESLAKKIPDPEPLGPITATRANPVPQVLHVEKKTRRKPNPAMDAMAMERALPAPTFQYAPVDRFAPN